MQLNVWCSGFFCLINKIPFNVGIKNKKGGSVAGLQIGSCKVGRALKKLWFVFFLVADCRDIITGACDSQQRLSRSTECVKCDFEKLIKVRAWPMSAVVWRW